MNLANILEISNQNYDNELLNYNESILTHKELDFKSNQFANFLLKNGINKGDRIAVIMDLSIDTIIAIFGIIKCGAIYVACDTKQNKDNINYVIDDVNPKCIILNEKYKELLAEYNKKNILICETHKFNEYLKFPVARPILNRKIISKDIISITYTSGSSGKPKGVIITHNSVITFINSVMKEFNHKIGRAHV